MGSGRCVSVFVISVVFICDSWLCRLVVVFVVLIGVCVLVRIGLVFSFVFICMIVMLVFVLLDMMV